MTLTNITDNQKALLQLENYDICKILNNTILGIFIGLISGTGIEAFMNQSGSSGTTNFIICCSISIFFMILSMELNSYFSTKCYQKIRELENAADAKAKTVRNKVKYKNGIIIGYYFTFISSLFIFGCGLYILKSEGIFEPIQNAHHQEHISNFDTLKIQHKQLLEPCNINSNKNQKE
jgi:hypothetical protein